MWYSVDVMNKELIALKKAALSGDYKPQLDTSEFRDIFQAKHPQTIVNILGLLNQNDKEDLAMRFALERENYPE